MYYDTVFHFQCTEKASNLKTKPKVTDVNLSVDRIMQIQHVITTPVGSVWVVDINHCMHVWLLCEMLKMRGDENWIKLCVAAHCREVIRDKHWDAESDLSCWRLSEIGAVSPSVPVAQWLEFPNVGLMACQPGAEPLHGTTHNNKWSKIKPD